MLSIVNSMSLKGIEGYLVEVQTDITGGLPTFEIVGLPGTSVREAKERVRAAIKNTQIEFPSRRILINLAPANTKKDGSLFDLPIAIGILLATEKIEKTNLKETIFLGELSLDGKINKIKGVLPMCIEAEKLGIKRVILPKENAKEAAVVKKLEVIPIENLEEAIKYLNKEIQIKKEETDIEAIFNKNNQDEYDFSEVKGQESVKRALEIAAAGGHNCLMIGSPGSGKTMMAKRLPSILPDLTFKEALEVTKIHSIAGLIDSEDGIIHKRPFRMPHHTISKISLVGGGITPKPGEISLAHYGVLFLDEMPEFNKNTLEVMRGPLEDGEVTINRINASIKYPSKFMLIGSMNPCKCGYFGSKEKECICTKQSISKYLETISGPLLDRFDIHIEVKAVKYEKLNSKEKIETSKEIKTRVDQARKIQIERYQKDNIYSNSELTQTLIEKHCKLDEKSKKILEISFKKLGLSARAYSKILKVARTIADLEAKQNIETKHIAEAIGYRSLDKKYWEG